MFRYSRKQRAQTLITKLLASAAFFTPRRRYHQMRVERRFDQSIVWGKLAGMLLPSRTSVRRRDGYIPTSYGLAKGTPRAASSSWHSSPAGSYTIPPSIEERGLLRKSYDDTLFHTVLLRLLRSDTYYTIEYVCQGARRVFKCISQSMFVRVSAANGIIYLDHHRSTLAGAFAELVQPGLGVLNE